MQARVGHQLYQKEVEIYPDQIVAIDSTLDLPVQLGPCGTSLLELKCSFQCDSAPELTQILNKPSEETSMFSYWQYWLFLTVITFASLSFGSGCTFQESICHEVIDEIFS